MADTAPAKSSMSFSAESKVFMPLSLRSHYDLMTVTSAVAGDRRRARSRQSRIFDKSHANPSLRILRISGFVYLDKTTAHRHNNGVMLVRFTQPEKPGQRITRPCVHRAVWFAIGMATNRGRSRGG